MALCEVGAVGEQHDRAGADLGVAEQLHRVDARVVDVRPGFEVRRAASAASILARSVVGGRPTVRSPLKNSTASGWSGAALGDEGAGGRHRVRDRLALHRLARVDRQHDAEGRPAVGAAGHDGQACTAGRSRQLDVRRAEIALGGQREHPGAVRELPAGARTQLGRRRARGRGQHEGGQRGDDDGEPPHRPAVLASGRRAQRWCRCRRRASMPLVSSLSTNFGRRPVGCRLPTTVAVLRDRVDLEGEQLLHGDASPSMRWTSVIEVTRRAPSCSRSMWMIRSSAEATCWRIARTGRSKPAIRTMVSTRASASRARVGVDRRQRAVVARVHRLEHVQRLGAADLADDDAVGPHAQARCARGRGSVTSPSPSMLRGRDSSRSTWRWLSCSSAASSIVTMRSSSGIAVDSALSSVVLPEPVPPEMRMFSSPTQAMSRNSAASVVSVPEPHQVVERRAGCALNLRIVTQRPARATAAG